MKRIMLAATLLLATAVQAEEMMFYERPSFMAESMPLKIDCSMSTEHYGRCLADYKAPASVVVKVTDQSGQRVQVKEVNPLITVTCRQSICANDRTGEPVGEVDMSALDPSYTISWTMIDGYYLVHDPKTGVWAYKRGFGPKADKYPPYAIFTEPVQKMSSNTDSNTYDVTCLPNSDTCDFKGQQVTRQELVKLIPKKNSQWCDNEFCYATEFFEGVIGINPDGYL
ncbi:hypothetical protein JVX91_14900 [Pseudomonas sp. PDNC002]|uniref:hypothetical protein n=1 Tax=Pseudomonas sp. PDNC002 TaxID=2811422 RepID=UPI001964B035|nr:hypothetical protein [Pseudomonas sp. PDNC002]QRY76908.1 hypothetical protein JVX91_14900 [Pseudomonas sp. PDNC002]